MLTTENLKLGCFAIILGIGLFIFGVLFLSRFDFYMNSAEVEGQVTNIDVEKNTCSRKTANRRRRSTYTCYEYTAIVQYATPQGNHTTGLSFGFLTSYQIGQKVDILYDTRYPTTAYPNSITVTWIGQLFMLTLAFLFMLIFFNKT